MYKLLRKIRIVSDPDITGSPNGVYSVELKEKQSFGSLQSKQYYHNFFAENSKNSSRAFEVAFKEFDSSAIDEIVYYPSFKRVKELDFMLYRPFEFGLDCMISEKTWKMMSSFKLPLKYNKIPVKIDTFKTDYYLMGFPIIDEKEIDLLKSTFIDCETERKRRIKSYEEYNELIDFDVYPKELYLVNKYEYDIVNLQGNGLFLSGKLLEVFKEHNINGYIEQNTRLYLPK